MPEALPTWSLSDLYQGIDDPAIAADMAACRQRAVSLQQRFEGKVADTDGASLALLIADYEQITEAAGRILCHADLLFASNMADAAIAQHSQTMREQSADIETALLFVELELSQMPEAAYQEALKDESFYHYQPWLRRVRAAASYMLEPRLEKMLIDRGPAGRAAWVRLFDETSSALRFPFQDGEVSEAEILNHLSSTEAQYRKEAGQSLSQVMQANQRLFGLIINVIAKEKEVDDRWRGFDRPVASRNLANDVDDVVVDALAEAVTSRMGDISHRYYQLKASWNGLTSMPWWDRNAPLSGDDDRRYSWAEAQEIVLSAFDGFDPKMGKIARRFFDEGWIDAGIREGKASGAFSHPTIPSAHPYILMNFDGRARDVMTLAHEMGHGIHQVLAAEQGLLMADTPLTLAETASVFAEMLTFNKLLARTSDADARRFLLAGKVEDMLNTVVRQIAFHNFETALHNARREGELSTDQISDIWMRTQTEALGEGITLDESYRPVWAYIPHFIHTPFYVYAYAFGDCLVNALWQVYQSGEMEDFNLHYQSLLAGGGTKRYDVALSGFGLDAQDPAFWHRGLDMISGMIDELEALS